MTQAFQIALRDKQSPIPFVIPDMVNIRSPNPQASFTAFPAKRFSQKLCRPEIICPDWQSVPAVPGGALPPRRWLRLMRGAPPVPGQRSAAWITARSQRFVCHGLSPPRKTKARANDHTFPVSVTGPGSQSTRPCRRQSVFLFYNPGNKQPAFCLEYQAGSLSVSCFSGILDKPPTHLLLLSFYHDLTLLASFPTSFSIS